MKEQPAANASQAWHWPLDLDRYSRSASLDAEEERRLAALVAAREGKQFCHFSRLKRQLDQLVQPLLDAGGALGMQPNVLATEINAVLCAVYRRRRTYWGWTAAEWVETSAQARNISRNL
jgi:hypothetical protein